MKKTFNILKYISAGILLFLLMLFLLLSTGTLNPVLQRGICKMASDQINGEVSIAQLKGNVFSDFSIDTLLIRDGEHDLIELSNLKISYRFWALLRHRIEVDTVLLSQPAFYFLEGADSIWNIEKLMKEQVSPASDSVPTSSWSITVKQFVIQRLKAEIQPLDSSLSIPKKINADLNMAFRYEHDKLSMKMHHLTLETQQPYFHIVDMKLEAEMTDSLLRWDLFDLTLDQSKLTSRGSFPLLQPERAELSLKASPLDLADFDPWLTGVYGRADLDVLLERERDSSILNLVINQESQSFKVLAKIWNMDTLPTYSILARMDSLNMAYWTHQPDFRSTTRGTIEVQGEGFDVQQNTLTLKADLADLDFKNQNISDLSILLEKEKGKMRSRINGHTALGDIQSDIALNTMFGIPEYHASINVKHLNLAKIEGNELLASDLNIHIKAQGTDVIPGKMRSSITLETNNSLIFGEPLSDMKASFHINEKDYTIKGLNLNTSYLEATVGGRGNLLDKNSLEFIVTLKNSEKLLSALGQKAFHLDGGMIGEINGPIDHLVFNSELLINELELDSLRINNMQTQVQSAFSYGLMDTLEKSFINPISAITRNNFSVQTSSLVDQMIYKGYSLNNIKLDLEKQHESISGKTFMQAFSGSLETQFKVRNVFSVPQYTLQASLNQLDLAELIKNDSLHTSINLDFAAEGRGLSMDSLDIEVDIQSDDTKVFGQPVETIDSKIIYKHGYYRIDNFKMETPFIDAKIEGEGDINVYNKLDFYLNIKDLNKLTLNGNPKNIDFTGQINGTVLGTRDSLMLSSKIELANFTMDTLQIENILADASMEISDSTYSGFINLNLYHTKIQNLPFDTIQFSTEFTQESAQNSFTYYSSDSLNGSLYSTLKLGHAPTLYLNEMTLNFEQDSWTGGSDSSYIRFGQDTIELHAIEAHSKEGSLAANGIFSFNGNEKLQIDARDIEIRQIKGIQLLPLAITGNLSAGLRIDGTADNPTVNGFMTIDDPIVDTLQLKKIKLNVNYDKDLFTFESTVDEQKSQLMHATLEFPYLLSFKETLTLPAEDTPLKAMLTIDGFDLGRMNPLIPMDEIQTRGFLDATMTLDNTISNPSINGELSIDKGGFGYPTLGMYYDNITLDSKLINNRFLLDSLNLFSPKGKLQFKGLVEIDTLLQGDIKTMNLTMRGDNFQLFDSEMASAVINTNLDINGTPEKPVFSGYLSVLKSAFNVDLFMKEFNRVYDDSDIPMLLVARSENQQTLSPSEELKKTTQKATPDIYKNMKGSFDIEFPRNTWIKGENMNFELLGKIKAIKEGDRITFFGTLDVNKGYYKLYGRRLDFENGEIIFTGGSSLNPKLNFDVAYRFRDPESNLRKLNIIISDRLENPTVTFFIDDVAIEEKEAVSYLLFNKSLNQLNTKENSTMANSSFDLVLNQISGLVEEVLKSKLGLDVLEISGNEGWTQSTVSTGKYLTNKIYMNYEHTFAIDKKEKVIQPPKITLEYQIYRSIFIQATNQSSNSGFDFILKWSFK